MVRSQHLASILHSRRPVTTETTYVYTTRRGQPDDSVRRDLRGPQWSCRTPRPRALRCGLPSCAALSPRTRTETCAPGPGCKRSKPTVHLFYDTAHGGDTIDAERAGSDATAIRDWIEAAQAGDADAFDRLARHALPSLRRWALVRTGDPDDAEDVVQRTLIKAYAAIGSLRGAGAFHGWLYTIMRNVAGELDRRAQSRDRALQRLESARAQDAVQEGQGRSPRGSESTELADLVRTFLEELSDQQRAIMDLVDLQGMTPAEAGEMMGLKPSTARVHLLRARRRIRSRILAVRPSIVEDLS